MREWEREREREGVDRENFPIIDRVEKSFHSVLTFLSPPLASLSRMNRKNRRRMRDGIGLSHGAFYVYAKDLHRVSKSDEL